MSRKRIALALVLALSLSVLSLGGCTKQDTGDTGTTGEKQEGPKKGGTLAYYIGNPAYIDPYNTQESEGTQVEQSLFDSLTGFDFSDPTKIVPAAATSWEPNDDATVWTFKLREGAKFHDGSPVTAKDFVYAWNRIANPKTLNTATKKVDPSTIGYHLAAVKGYDEVQAGKATDMEGVKAVDDNTLEITLKQPFGDFEYVVAHPALAPVPQALVEGGVDFNGAKVAYGDMPIGNGPFKMAEPWKADQYVKVVRFEEYSQDKPNIDGIDFRIFKDTNTAYTEFEAGTLDFSIIGDGKINAAKEKYGESGDGYTGNPEKQVLLGSENAVYYLVVNNTDPIMKNDKLRKAISYAINRQAISDTVFDGTRAPADNIVPPGIAGYEEGVWAEAKYDVEAAKKMLADAGYPDGTGLPVLQQSFNNDGGHEKVMQLIQADLAKIGIKTRFDSADFPTYLKQLEAEKFQFGRLGWSADYPIMDNFLFPLFQSKATDNYANYTDATIDKELEDARKNTDRDGRIAAYREIDRKIGQAFPVIPIMFYRHHHVTSERVRDLNYSPMNLTDFQKVWIDEGSEQ